MKIIYFIPLILTILISAIYFLGLVTVLYGWFILGPFSRLKSFIIMKLSKIGKAFAGLKAFLIESKVRYGLDTPKFFNRIRKGSAALGLTSIYMVKNGIDFYIFGISVVTLFGGGGVAGYFIAKLMVKDFKELESLLHQDKAENEPASTEADNI